MNETDDAGQRIESNRPKLVSFGVALTVIWLLGGATYILFLGGYESLAESGAAGVGGFLEGFFAPLAFLWLVIGLFIQQRELAHNTQALHRTNLSSEKQTEVLEATELRARQNAFFQIAQNVRRQTGNLIGILLRSLRDVDGNLVISQAEMNDYWLEHQSTQSEIFPALLSTDERIVAAGLTYADVFYGTQEARNYTCEYIRSFRGLLALAKECDVDGAILRTVTQTPHGQIYAEMLNWMVSSVAWILLDEAILLGEQEADSNLEGTWLIRASIPTDDQEWVLHIQAESDGFSAKFVQDGFDIAVDEFHIDGAIMFGKARIQAYSFVLTAVAEGDHLRGSLDYRDGVYAQIEGSRQL